MITLLTGMPGAGKTAAMVDLLRQLGQDRPLFVHFDPAERLRPEQKLLSESLKLPHQTCNAATWHEQVPDGGILVIDEAQGCWRPRGPAAKVPECIAALETHRHAGIDIFITTQAPRLIDANVRGLVGRHVHIRDTGWLGRWWYEWPETNESLAWKTCPVKKRYKLPKKVFELYASANEHHAPVRAAPKTLALIAVLLLCLGVLIALFMRTVNNHTGQADEASEANKPVQSVPDNKPRMIEASAPATAALPDERVDFAPRISDRPWTAPAYDHLRQVIRMPIITGAICVNDACRCLNGRENLLEVSSEQCRHWVENRPFNPYAAPDETASGRTASNAGQTVPLPADSAAMAPSAAPYARPLL